MAVESKLSKLLNGVQRGVSLANNELLVQNIRVKGSSGDDSLYATFSSTAFTGIRTITVPDADVNLGLIASLVALSGVAGGETDLGTFTGTIIPDDSTIKEALRALESEAFALDEKIDSLAQGLEPKGSVKAASLAPVTLAPAPATVDGYTLVSGDRVLLKNQADPVDNGVYVFDGTDLIRASDFDGSPTNEVKGGDWVYVESGTQAGTSWALLGQGSKVVDTDPLNFTKINQVTALQAGNGIAIAADVISVQAANTTISVASGGISVNSAPLVVRNFVAGEEFVAPGFWGVRLAMNSLGETTGRVYKADNDATTNDEFYVIGLAVTPGATVSAGGNIPVYSHGRFQFATGAPFSVGDVGKPIFLGTDGALTVTPPSADLTAVVRVGIIMSTNEIFIAPQVMGVN